MSFFRLIKTICTHILGIESSLEKGVSNDGESEIMKNLDEAAQNLYSCLRKIKNNGYKSIAVEKIPNRGLGKVINDRLIRASKF